MKVVLSYSSDQGGKEKLDTIISAKLVGIWLQGDDDVF